MFNPEFKPFMFPKNTIGDFTKKALIDSIKLGRILKETTEYQAVWQLNGKALDEKNKQELVTAIENNTLKSTGYTFVHSSTSSSSSHSSSSSSTFFGINFGTQSKNSGQSHNTEKLREAYSFSISEDQNYTMNIEPLKPGQAKILPVSDASSTSKTTSDAAPKTAPKTDWETLKKQAAAAWKAQEEAKKKQKEAAADSKAKEEAEAKKKQQEAAAATKAEEEAKKKKQEAENASKAQEEAQKKQQQGAQPKQPDANSSQGTNPPPKQATSQPAPQSTRTRKR